MPDPINRALQQNQLTLQKTQARIASGLRINKAADDAAGAAIANRLSSRIDGQSQAIRNASDGLSLIQTAEGGLQSLTDNLQRIRELALQSANGTLADADRRALDAEAQSLAEEINRVVDGAEFNGRPLFRGADPLTLQVGPEAGDQLSIETGDLQQQLAATGLAQLDLSSAQSAVNGLSALDAALAQVDDRRAQLGAAGNRLDAGINQLLDSQLANQASRSRIQDADYAAEVSNLAQAQVREQAGIALRAQANAQSQQVLQLLR